MRPSRYRLPRAWRLVLFVSMIIVGAIAGSIVHRHRQTWEQNRTEEAVESGRANHTTMEHLGLFP